MTQAAFAHALLNPEAAIPPGIVDPQGRPAPKRFSVYRNNVASSLTRAREAAFPTVRKLVGDVLPETIDAYRRIPAGLRQEKRAGATPDEQLTESLTRISREIDHVTRQLAEGSLDDLAIKTRYLEYRYGENEQTSKEP